MNAIYDNGFQRNKIFVLHNNHRCHLSSSLSAKASSRISSMSGSSAWDAEVDMLRNPGHDPWADANPDIPAASDAAALAPSVLPHVRGGALPSRAPLRGAKSKAAKAKSLAAPKPFDRSEHLREARRHIRKRPATNATSSDVAATDANLSPPKPGDLSLPSHDQLERLATHPVVPYLANLHSHLLRLSEGNGSILPQLVRQSPLCGMLVQFFGTESRSAYAPKMMTSLMMSHLVQVNRKRVGEYEQLVAAVVLFQCRADRYELESYIASNVDFEHLLYIEAESSDETPLKVAVETCPVEVKEAITEQASASVKKAITEQASASSSPCDWLVRAPQRNAASAALGTNAKGNVPCKLLQSQSKWGALVRSKTSGKLFIFLGSSLNPLQHLDRTTAECFYHAYQIRKGITPHALVFQQKLRLYNLDQAGANARYETAVDVSRPGFRTIGYRCEGHIWGNGHKSTTEPMDFEIHGIKQTLGSTKWRIVNAQLVPPPHPNKKTKHACEIRFDGHIGSACR